MKGFCVKIKRFSMILLFFCTLSTLCSCATVKIHTEGLPPILAQDELLRPFERVATVSVRRHRYGDPSDLTPADYNWAFDAMREQARRIGADAVILPEVTVELHRYIFYPVSEMTAKGVAIKFK
jgi:hypothetical protein